MPKKNGPLNLELTEEFREDNLGFTVHEINGAFLREAVRFPVAVTRIHQHAAARGLSDSLRKILPHRDGAEPFMQHDDGGVLACGRVQERFEALAVYAQVFASWRCGGQTESPRKHLENRFSRIHFWSMLIGGLN